MKTTKKGALPEEFQGLYSPEEMPVDDSKLEEKPIEVNYTLQEETNTKQEEQKISLAQAKRMFAIAQGDKDIVR